MQHEILDSVYDDNVQQIVLLLGLKDVVEIDPPTGSLPGEPVGDIRWIRKVSESFVDNDLEVRSSVTFGFGPGSTEIFLYDVSRLPNEGLAVINRGSATEESITYTGKDVASNKLTGISNPIYSHSIGELVYPSVDIDFLGAFEVDLRPFGVDNIRGPIRYGRSRVMLNGVIELKENIDYSIVNEFTGDICSRTRLRFENGGQPRRFSPGQRLDVTYEFFVQNPLGAWHPEGIGWIKVYTSPGIVSWVQVYQKGFANIAFSTLASVDRKTTPAGNIRITPPFGNATLPPVPVKVVIPDIKLPVGVSLTQPLNVSDAEAAVSDVSRFPALGTLLDAADDAANREVVINGDAISYTDIDLVNKKLVGLGAHLAHPIDSLVEFNGARYIRDVVKDAVNKTTLRGQLEAASIDGGPTGPYHLEIRIKGSTGSFNLQPGTYRLSYVGFDDYIDRGLHKSVVTSVPFEAKDLTFERYETIADRQQIAKGLLGQTTSYRQITSGTNPTDTTFDIP